MKKEYKNIYSKIAPDENLLEKVLDSADTNGKRKSGVMPKRILAAAMCLVILCVGGGIGYHHYFGDENSITSESTSSSQIKTSLGFTIVAYASDDTEQVKSLSDSISTLINFEIIVEDIRGKNEEEIENTFNELKKKYDISYEKQDGYNSFKRQFQRLENAVIGRAVYDFFDVNVDNPEEVKTLRVSNESDYGYMLIHAFDQHFDDEGNTLIDTEYSDEMFQNEFIRGNDVSISGERFEKCKRLEQECGKIFEIEWQMDDNLYQAINNNPDMDLSTVSDTVTFTVEYKDGSVAQSKMDIHFDSDGKMSVKLHN